MRISDWSSDVCSSDLSRNLSPIRGRARYEDDAATGNSAAQPAAGERTTLNFNDAELHGVLRALAQFTGRNFVVDPRVRGQLTLISETDRKSTRLNSSH